MMKNDAVGFADYIGEQVNIDRLYILSNVERYSTMIHKVNESVLDHISMVAVISKVLSHHYQLSDVDENKCIAMALCHDLPESYIGDITAEAKRSVKKLGGDISGFKDVEMQVMETKFPFFFEEFKEYESQSTIPAKIVKLADLLDVYFYAKQEIESGNHRFDGEHLETIKELLIAKKNEVEEAIAAN